MNKIFSFIKSHLLLFFTFVGTIQLNYILLKNSSEEGFILFSVFSCIYILLLFIFYFKNNKLKALLANNKYVQQMFPDANVFENFEAVYLYLNTIIFGAIFPCVAYTDLTLGFAELNFLFLMWAFLFQNIFGTPVHWIITGEREQRTNLLKVPYLILVLAIYTFFNFELTNSPSMPAQNTLFFLAIAFADIALLLCVRFYLNKKQA